MSVDLRLIDDCRRSDERAQYLLYKECHSLMKGICLRYIKKTADIGDVMNLGFYKVIRSLNTYDQKRPFEAWVSRILINTCLDYHRKQRQTAHISAMDPAEGNPFSSNGNSSWNLADLDFDAQALIDMIHQLPDRTAQVFNLFAIDGYSHKEISQLLGISSGTSKWHVSKAREELKMKLINENQKEPHHL